MAQKLAFKMQIQDIFEIKNRGIVVTGVVEYGEILIEDRIEVLGFYKNSALVTGIEKDRNLISKANLNDAVGLLLRDVDSEQIAIGDILVLYK